MQDRKIYERSLSDYPDVLTVPDLQRALDGMCEKTIRGIIWRGEISSFKIGTKHMIPKESLIDYMLSDSYKVTMKRRMAAKQAIALQKDLILNRDRLLNYCCQPRSKKEMMQFLNLNSPKLFYRLFLDPLLETGELHRTVKNQACISTQKYIRGVRIKY